MVVLIWHLMGWRTFSDHECRLWRQQEQNFNEVDGLATDREPSTTSSFKRQEIKLKNDCHDVIVAPGERREEHFFHCQREEVKNLRDACRHVAPQWLHAATSLAASCREATLATTSSYYVATTQQTRVIQYNKIVIWGDCPPYYHNTTSYRGEFESSHIFWWPANYNTILHLLHLISFQVVQPFHISHALCYHCLVCAPMNASYK